MAPSPSKISLRRLLLTGLIVAVSLLDGASRLSAQGMLIAPTFSPSARFELSQAVQIDNVDGTARTSLENVRAYLANENWDDAVETLRQVQQLYGDQIIALDDHRFVTVRDFAHREIARLPEPALDLYRARVDPQAERWFEQAKMAHDEEQLKRVVEQFYCSSSADEAMLLLGEISLERGDASMARYWWSQISPLLRDAGGLPAWIAVSRDDLQNPAAAEVLAQFRSRESPPRWLAYPDTDLPLAEVRARLALVSIFSGEYDRASTEVALLEALHPDAMGRLGGKQAPYAKAIAELLRESREWPSVDGDDSWRTFAKNNRRDAVLADPLEFYARPSWTTRLLNGLAEDDQFPEASEMLLNDLAAGIHPIIAGGQVFYSNGEQVFALDLQTGKPAWSDRDGFGQVYPGGLQPRAEPPRELLRSTIESLGNVRHTLTAADGLLFARLGSPVTSRPVSEVPAREGSFLVCLDLNKQGSLRWRYPTATDMPDFIEKNWAFEGAPVSDGEHIYVAMRRSDVRPQAHVACFDARSGELRWRRFVVSADTPASTQHNEITHNLLTLHEGVLYVNTNLGAVAALETSDGTPRWIYRYERLQADDLSRQQAYQRRDVNPCIVANDLVFAGPSDAPGILALDAATGQLVWRTSPTTRDAWHPDHILGVVDGHLIATGRNVWWFDVVSGRTVAVWPHGNDNGELGFGRGVLSEDFIYWPTREEIFVFDARLPRPNEVRLHRRFRLDRPDLPQPLSGGNLVAGEGLALIVSRNQIHAFRQEPPQDASRDR